MKKSYLLTLALAAVMAVGGLAGCSKSDDEEQVEFSFSVDIEGDYADLEIRSEPYKLVVYDNGVDNADRKYTYSSSAPAVAEILPNTGAITAKSVGSVTFTCTEQNSGLKAYKTVSVVEAAPKAQGGYNFAAAGTAEERQARTEILGKLEKYAMDTHLTGISLFENGGYMLFSQRAKDLLPTTKYITGYGFGLLSDADHGFTSDLSGGNVDATHKRHYHTASSSDPGSINALNAAGSQVSDLSSYITSSYFSQRMNGNKDGAYWYPVLASDVHNADTAEGLPKMFHTGADNPTNMYTGWKIYVKTDENTGGNLKYRYNGPTSFGPFNNRGVKLEDYEFIIRFLLTGSHNLRRGNEMAADTSYGIKGAQSYNLQTADTDDDTSKTIWKTMQDSGKLGFRTGTDEKGDYLEFELMNPIDSFTAMYTLSSSLYSPIPEDFMLAVGANKDGSDSAHRLDRAAKRYGAFNNNDDLKGTDLHNNILASTICLGPYFLEEWIKNEKTIFTRNDSWFECGTRYQIAGVRIRINEAITDNLDAYYDEFKAGNLDACSLPQKHMDEKASAYEAEGDSVFKLNVNSCTQEQWDYNFKGDSGKIAKNRHWDVKPWMSNDNFLNGLFWSIDRKTFAEARGVRPSINYFSGAYMSDPQENISYNSTKAHKDAVRAYHNVRYDGEGEEIPGTDDYGYNKDTAINYFKAAVAQLVKRGALKYGTVDNPEVIKIEIWWMYQSDISEYGNDIKNYFESAFNDPKVSGKRIKLNVVNNAVTVWEYVYDQHLMVGEFDLGFGAISGNTYNPLNFMEVLKSDNSSTFTLNWGADTSIVDPRHSLVYDGKKYSYDALWEVADHGGIVNEGRKVAAIEDCYLETFSTLKTKSDRSLKVNMDFVDVGSTAQFQVTDVRLYVIGGKMFGPDEGVTLTYEGTKQIPTLHFDIYQEYDEVKGQYVDVDPLVEIEKSIQHANKWDLPEYTGDEKTKDHLKRDGNYGVYWYVDVTYTISINGGQPTINYAAANATSGHWN